MSVHPKASQWMRTRAHAPFLPFGSNRAHPTVIRTMLRVANGVFVQLLYGPQRDEIAKSVLRTRQHTASAAMRTLLMRQVAATGRMNAVQAFHEYMRVLCTDLCFAASSQDVLREVPSMSKRVVAVWVALEQSAAVASSTNMRGLRSVVAGSSFEEFSAILAFMWRSGVASASLSTAVAADTRAVARTGARAQDAGLSAAFNLDLTLDVPRRREGAATAHRAPNLGLGRGGATQHPISMPEPTYLLPPHALLVNHLPPLAEVKARTHFLSDRVSILRRNIVHLCSLLSPADLANALYTISLATSPPSAVAAPPLALAPIRSSVCTTDVAQVVHATRARAQTGAVTTPLPLPFMDFI